MNDETILVTGAGTGFGKSIAFKLAEMGKKVIAGVEVMSQVSALEKEAREKGLTLQLEQLDVTNPKDHEKAWKWDIDILVNNAAIKEGGSLLDIPEENLRRKLDVNALSPIILTKGLLVRWYEIDGYGLCLYLRFPACLLIHFLVLMRLRSMR